MIGHSSEKSAATGWFTQTYNGVLIEPNAIAPGGMGIEIAGSTTKRDNIENPSAAIRVEGAFANAALDTRAASFTTGASVLLGAGQAICFAGSDGCVRYVGGLLSYNLGSSTPWSISANGHMLATISGGSFTGTPHYVGNAADSAVEGISGSNAAPDGTSGAAGAFEKFSSATAYNALAGLAHKTNFASNARATGVYGEANDTAGGPNSLVKGGRFQGTLTRGTGGSAYGAVCVAGTAAMAMSTPAYLIGCQGEINNQIGPDASTFLSFDVGHFSASFLATNGTGSGRRYKADAAFAVSSRSVGSYQTGLLLSPKVTDTGIAAIEGTRLTSGLDLHLASISFAAIIAPNNAPFRFANAARTADLAVLNLDSSENLQIGTDVAGKAIMTPPLDLAKGYARLAGTTFSALPICNRDAAGTIAYITDASAAITTWHQPVIAGGGANKAFVACNGSGWNAFDY